MTTGARPSGGYQIGDRVKLRTGKVLWSINTVHHDAQTVDLINPDNGNVRMHEKMSDLRWSFLHRTWSIDPMDDYDLSSAGK